MIGDYEGARAAVEGAEDKMFLDNGAPDDALTDAATAATTAIEAYNNRL